MTADPCPAEHGLASPLHSVLLVPTPGSGTRRHLEKGLTMSELRSAKLLSATLLICAGAVCVTIGGLPTGESARTDVGALLLAFGIPMLVRQWTGRGF